MVKSPGARCESAKPPQGRRNAESSSSGSVSVMIVTAWNNGAHHVDGAGYGVRLDIRDRDRFFKREWKTAILQIEGNSEDVVLNVDKDSFWNPSCRELISKSIGRWLHQVGLAPWPYRKPPKLILQPLRGNRFILRTTNASDEVEEMSGAKRTG